MAKTPDDDTRQAVALFRYGLIADLVNLPPGTPGTGARLRAKAERDYDIPGTHRTRVAAETIRDWVRLYRRGGFDALHPRPRADRGRPRRLSAEVAELLISVKAANPAFSVRAVIDEARRQGVPDDIHLAASTVHRLLAREGLFDRDADQPVADRRRFAYRYAGELWMSDVMHGPSVPDGRRRRKTYLVAFIDDATRVIPHAAFAFSNVPLAAREHRRLPAGAQAGAHAPRTAGAALRRQRCRLPLPPARPRLRQARHRADPRQALPAGCQGLGFILHLIGTLRDKLARRGSRFVNFRPCCLTGGSPPGGS